MIEINLVTNASKKRDLKQTVLVASVGIDGSLSDHAKALDEASGGLICQALSAAGKLEVGQTVDLFAPHGLDIERLIIMILPLGAAAKSLEMERVGAKLANKLNGLKRKKVLVGSTAGLDLPADPETVASWLGSGAMLISYRFNLYFADQAEEHVYHLKSLEFIDLGKTAKGMFESARARALGNAAARDLVSEPANILYPESFAKRCRELEKLGCDVEILGPNELEKLGMRALLGVGQGSAKPPYVVVMRWQGGKKKDAPLALVGKGVCFDTGGISLKPAGGMEEMKWDMGGAGAVVGAMHSLAGRKAKANVVALIGLAENMPSGTAQRPGDVVKAMSGTTIEVINTDAEGRLVLADVLWYTQERFKPKAIVDLATLTGAVIVALGHENAGLFANDDTLAQQLQASATATGEDLWRLPLGANYHKHIKSAIADIKNVGRAREAGATAGAVFLERFVNEVPWAHLDIAGTAWTNRDLPLSTKGATGFGVRLLDQLVADHFETSN